MRAGQRRAIEDLAAAIVVEPVLARLEADDDRVPGLREVGGSALVGRGVAAPDTAAFGTPIEVPPPLAGNQACGATVPTGHGCRMDTIHRSLHLPTLSFRGICVCWQSMVAEPERSGLYVLVLRQRGRSVAGGWAASTCNSTPLVCGRIG